MNSKISTELKSHFLRLYQMALTDDKFDIIELKTLYKFAEDRNIPKDINTRIEYLYDLAFMILADGVITEDEKNTLIKYCKKFDFLEENAEKLSNYLLECVQNGTSKEEIIKNVNN